MWLPFGSKLEVFFDFLMSEQEHFVSIVACSCIGIGYHSSNLDLFSSESRWFVHCIDIKDSCPALYGHQLFHDVLGVVFREVGSVCGLEMKREWEHR